MMQGEMQQRQMAGADAMSLDAALLAAHAAADHDSLVDLYRQAGELREVSGDIDAACFFFTHAYVFALETGNPQADELRQRLVVHGREATE